MENIKNYFSLEKDHIIQLHGFNEITNFFFVSLPKSKDSVIINSRDCSTKTDYYYAKVDTNRTIQDERIFFILYRFKAFNKRFIYNEVSQNYFLTDMDL